MWNEQAVIDVLFYILMAQVYKIIRWIDGAGTIETMGTSILTTTKVFFKENF